jgi:hypothetical protein
MSASNHPTRVASIIGVDADGYAIGVAKNVVIHSVSLMNFLLQDPSAVHIRIAEFTRAVDWVVSRKQVLGKPVVVNMSFNIARALLDPDPGNKDMVENTFRDKITELLSNDITVVVSAGNCQDPAQEYLPANLGDLDGVIVAGGIDAQDGRWRNDPDGCFNGDEPGEPNYCTEPGGYCGSNYGSFVDIWAPAADIVALGVSGGSADYTASSGTSFAAPHVVGVAAMYLQTHPSATPAEVEATLKTAALRNELAYLESGSPNRLLNSTFLGDTLLSAHPDYVDVTSHSMQAISAGLLMSNDYDSYYTTVYLSITGTNEPALGTLWDYLPIGYYYVPDPEFWSTCLDSFVYFVTDPGGSLSGSTVTLYAASQGDAVFDDVPIGHPDRTYIENLYASGLTTGCASSPLRFCPDRLVTRAEMAVLLTKAIHGSDFVPDDPVGLFADVPTTHWSARWVEQLWNDGLTKGCGYDPGPPEQRFYCPGREITKAEMAKFILTGKHGAAYSPPTAQGMFTDVPAGHWSEPWNEQAFREGIIHQCNLPNQALQYCREDTLTRADTAGIFVRAFDLFTCLD